MLDPPRRGCDQALIDTVSGGLAPRRVVYVSCDPATLARDLKLFSTQGYAVQRVQPVDLFPRHRPCGKCGAAGAGTGNEKAGSGGNGFSIPAAFGFSSNHAYGVYPGPFQNFHAVNGTVRRHAY